jgi:hypothetical protein
MGLLKYAGGRTFLHPLSSRRDRRQACRNAVILPDASLGWWEDSRFVSTPGRIIDISLYGCKVETHRAPGRRDHESVWLCPLGVSPHEWAEGLIISSLKPLFQRCQLGLKFVAPFPYESFKTLVCGPGRSQENVREDSPEHEQDHLWR